MPCLIPREEVVGRKIFGLFVGCQAVFIYLFTLVYMDYIKQVQKNKYVDWDKPLLGCSDYYCWRLFYGTRY